MARVSILLPVYNGQRYLHAAIESILAQTFSNWELIVCDDLSTDDSLLVAQRYSEMDSRIRVFRNERNLGLFENYNRCLRIALNGDAEFIKPFAQDDLLQPVALEHLTLALDENLDVALVSCGRNWIGDDGTATGIVRPFKSDRKIKDQDVIIYNLIQLTNWVGEPSTVLFRASRARQGFDTELFHYGDIDYWFQIVEGSNYYYLDEVLCGFRRHAGSATSKNLNGLYFALDIMRLGRKYRKHLELLGESEAHFYKRAVETIALNLDHLVRGDALNLEGLLSARRTRGLQADRTSTEIALGATSELVPDREDGVTRNAAPGTGADTVSSRAYASQKPLEDLIDCSPSDLRSEQTRVLSPEDGFRELSFHALRYVTHLLYELSDLQHRTRAEREHLEQQIADIKGSTSWKITAPLRNIMRSGREG